MKKKTLFDARAVSLKAALRALSRPAPPALSPTPANHLHPHHPGGRPNHGRRPPAGRPGRRLADAGEKGEGGREQKKRKRALQAFVFALAARARPLSLSHAHPTTHAHPHTTFRPAPTFGPSSVAVVARPSRPAQVRERERGERGGNRRPIRFVLFFLGALAECSAWARTPSAAPEECTERSCCHQTRWLEAGGAAGAPAPTQCTRRGRRAPAFAFSLSLSASRLFLPPPTRAHTQAEPPRPRRSR